MTLIKKTIQQYGIFDGILRKEDKRDAGASLCREARILQGTFRYQHE